MYTPPTECYYVLDMIDHSSTGFAEYQVPTLDGIATKVLGRKYVGQQTGDMISNDSDIRISMNEDDVEQYLHDDDYGSYIPKRQPWESDEKYPSGTVLNLKDWLALDPADFEYDFQHYRLAPSWQNVMAYLIKNGHLPYGEYLIRVSW